MEKLIPNAKIPRYLLLLGMLTPVLWSICLVSQGRLVSLHSGYISAAILPYPFLCCIFDIIAEIYGYKESRKTLWSACISVYIFAITIYLFTKLPGPAFWQSHTDAFNTTMNQLFRVLICNSFGFIIGQYINLYVFSKLRLLVNGKFFGLRSIGSTLIGDTLTFAISLFGDFSGLMKNHTIFVLVIDELLIMYIMAIILAIPASFLVSILRKKEPEYNSGVNFNPFK